MEKTGDRDGKGEKQVKQGRGSNEKCFQGLKDKELKNLHKKDMILDGISTSFLKINL